MTVAPMIDVRPLAHLRGRHFLDDQDFTPSDLVGLLELSSALKQLRAHRRLTPFLRGRHLAMIFEEPSTRTRVSFELAMAELGGDALYLRPGEIHLPGRETVGDTARVLSRYVDAIEARLLHHEVLLELARYAEVPVVNGLTDRDHPVQTMSDALTILEAFGHVDGVRVAFLGDATNVCNSLLLTGTRLGMDMTIANPPAYRVDEALVAAARVNASESGSRVRFTSDPIDAVHDADVVYTDLWWWVGQEREAEERTAAMQPFQVNEALLHHAPSRARVMHCLPASRGHEITDAVLDGPRAIVWEQAENRLHFEKALLLALVGLDEEPEDDALRAVARALLP